jgi:ABC-type nitrate/sulfonate/bicarbonate transport system ATPase subunit
MNVEVSDITFGFKNDGNDKIKNKYKIVLDNISFSVQSSASVSIVGASGCGKSTLLRVLCGLLPNSKGQLFSGRTIVDGCEILKNKIRWGKMRSDGDIGFMFQENGLFPHLNVEENIHLPLNMIGKQDEEDEIVSELLKTVGLENHKHDMPNKLSGGQAARTALARTFVTKPKLLLLDEPFSSLDIEWKSKLYEKVKNLKDKNKTTVILVTHDIFEAITLSEQIIVLGKDHRITEIININNWTKDLTYFEVVRNFQNDFMHIKDHIGEEKEA